MLVSTEMDSPQLVYIVVNLIEVNFKNEIKRPKIDRKLKQLQSVLQPDTRIENFEETLVKDFNEVKEWLKQYID